MTKKSKIIGKKKASSKGKKIGAGRISASAKRRLAEDRAEQRRWRKYIAKQHGIENEKYLPCPIGIDQGHEIGSIARQVQDYMLATLDPDFIERERTQRELLKDELESQAQKIQIDIDTFGLKEDPNHSPMRDQPSNELFLDDFFELRSSFFNRLEHESYGLLGAPSRDTTENIALVIFQEYLKDRRR